MALLPVKNSPNSKPKAISVQWRGLAVGVQDQIRKKKGNGSELNNIQHCISLLDVCIHELLLPTLSVCKGWAIMLSKMMLV